MNQNPVVSVIINFLNGGEYLSEAIESVFSQTYINWELLLVDDGSTDTSTHIALQYVARYPERLRYLEHPGHQNKGASASRNLGMKQAKGKYLAFLDADDVWLPHKLEQQVAILESRTDVAMVYGRGKWWYSWTGNPEDAARDFIPELGIPLDKVFSPPTLLNHILQNESATPSSFAIMVDREKMLQVGGSEEACRTIYDDQMVFAKICLNYPVMVLGECWYWYRQHDNQRCQVTSKTGQYHSVRYDFLCWLERYLSQQACQYPTVRKVLNQELWPYRHPRQYRLSRKFQKVVSRVKRIIKSLATQTLPPSVLRWLLLQRQRLKITTT